MRVLAIDTALSVCSAAVLDADLDVALAVGSHAMERGHAEALMPLVHHVVEAAGGMGRIDRVVATVGPGSFTGLRVGLAAARGLGLGLGRTVVGVTTLAAIAAPHLGDDDRRPVAVCIDARHGRVYLQMFAPGGRTIVAARTAGVRDAARAIGTGPVRMVGTGAAAVLAVSEFAGGVEVLDEAFDVPDVLWVARLGAVADPAASPPRPFYLLAPDAKPSAGGRVARA